MIPTTCAVCQEPLVARARPGNPRRYCSSACRNEAYRARLERSSELDDLDVDLPRLDSTTLVRAQLVAVAEELAVDRSSAPPEEQLARALLEARTLATALIRLEPRLPTGLAWRSATLGEQLLSHLSDLFESEPPR